MQKVYVAKENIDDLAFACVDRWAQHVVVCVK